MLIICTCWDAPYENTRVHSKTLKDSGLLRERALNKKGLAFFRCASPQKKKKKNTSVCHQPLLQCYIFEKYILSDISIPPSSPSSSSSHCSCSHLISGENLVSLLPPAQDQQCRSWVCVCVCVFGRLVWMEAVACWSYKHYKQVNTLALHNSLSLAHLNAFKSYSSLRRKTSSRLCPGHGEWKPDYKSLGSHNNHHLGRKLPFIRLFTKSYVPLPLTVDVLVHVFTH